MNFFPRCFSYFANNRVVGYVWTLKDGSDESSDIFARCNGREFFSCSQDIGFILLDVDASNWIWKGVDKKKPSSKLVVHHMPKLVKMSVYVILPCAANSLR